MPKALLCPACRHPLSVFNAGTAHIDVCQGGCGGVWFDAQELKRMDEPKEAVPREAFSIPYDETRMVKHADRQCPYCPEQVMRQHPFSVKGKIVVDSCPKCGGCFLDRGELQAIREEYPSEDARTAAAMRAFENQFSGAMAEAKAESTAKVQKAQAFAHALRFILPSYWIPGKQDGAAF